MSDALRPATIIFDIKRPVVETVDGQTHITENRAVTIHTGKQHQPRTQQPEAPKRTVTRGEVFVPRMYDKPSIPDMAIVMVYYNPTFSVRHIQNILMVKHFLESSDLPLYIGELAFDETPFLFAPAGNILQFRTTSYLHYKANLISTIVRRIPSKHTKICVIDDDVLFGERNWYSVVSEALDNYDVCQPFKKAHALGINFRTLKTTIAALDGDGYSIDLNKEQCGYVWAFHRNWYKAAAITDLTVAGGSSLYLLYLLKEFDIYEHPLPVVYRELVKPVDATTGTCNLTVYKLFRGEEHRRNIKQCLIDTKKLCAGSILSAVERRKDNILEWKHEFRAALNRYMYRYFANLGEDGVTLPPIHALKFYPEPYDTPKTKDMVVILVFFNPNPYVRIIQNILTIRHLLESAKIPYYIAELAFVDQPFLFKPAANIFQFRSNSYMFYKENLIRVVEPKIPEIFTKLCILDADVMFDRRNWYSIVSNTLNTVEVCQPFKRSYWMNLEYRVIQERTNCVDCTSSIVDWDRDHPGFVWAFNRTWAGLKKYLNVRISTIGGDSLLMFIIRKCTTNLNDMYDFNIEPPSVASADLSVYHLNHGSLKRRKYYDIVEETTKLVKKYGKTSIEDLTYYRADGILEWTKECIKEMNDLTLRYFRDRCEDEEDES